MSLQLLATACIVDGRLTKREKVLFRDALAAAGQSLDLGTLEALRLCFIRGDEGVEKVLAAI